MTKSDFMFSMVSTAEAVGATGDGVFSIYGVDNRE
jgi:hypothetical protein